MKITYIGCKEEVSRSVDGHNSVERKFCTEDLQLIELLKENHEVISLDINELDQIKEINPDVIFNCADEFTDSFGEANFSKQLEETSIPFTGCTEETILNCSDKAKAKFTFRKNNIPTPKFQVITNKDELISEFMNYPLILKPTNSDASLGIDEDSVVSDEKKLRKKLESLFLEHKEVLVEEYVDGREFCIPMIGNGTPQVLPILEIDYSEHFEGKPKILSYKAKWRKNSNAFKNTYSRIAENLEPELEITLKTIASSVFSLLKCTGYATIDIRLDSNGNVYVLEVNPNPYLSKDCDTFKAAQKLNISNVELLNKLLDLAIDRKKQTIPLLAKN